MQLEILMRKDTNGLFLKMKRTGIVAWVRMTIGLNFQTELFLNTSVFWAYTRVLHKALENISNEYMGFQSVLYNPSDIYGPLRTNGYRLIVYKGAMKNPSGHMEFIYPIQTASLFGKGLRTLTG